MSVCLNQANQDCPMDKLTDVELCEIFKRLPPCERLLVSEVCRHWYEISCTPWRDVTALDLNPIPGAHLHAIVKQYPNLQSVFALGKSFALNQLACLRAAENLTRVQLYDCTFTVRHEAPTIFYDFISQIFSESLQQASLDELVLHKESLSLQAVEPQANNPLFSADALPVSLKRLQLTGDALLKCAGSLAPLQNLECLFLQYYCLAVDAMEDFRPLTVTNVCITALQNLRELCIDNVRLPDFKVLVSRLPFLTVIWTTSIRSGDGESVDPFVDVITKPSALRILVLSGNVRGNPAPMQIPARKRFPNGFGSDPLPLLNIFVSDDVSHKIHFTPSDAAVVYTINAPIREFLEREDIAPIFEGVWIAEKIKEATKYGVQPLRD